ncbi:MAG: S41 family peptidase [Patescibacteria group bacterium]|nr:S41 family peptidase [Patescibacteria group bacterium]
MKKFISIFLILISFSIGFAVSDFFNSLNNKENITGLVNLDSDENNAIEDKADFSLFWDAWKMIEDDYTIEQLDYQKMVHGAISGMVDSLDDPYTVFLTPEENKMFNQDMSGKFGGIGAEIGFRDGLLTIIAPLKNSPAERAGLLPGDIVLEVDGEEIIGANIDKAVYFIRGEKGTKVILTISREGLDELKEIEITRDIITVETVEWEMLENNIAYINISQFNEDTAFEFDNYINDILIENPKGIILDLRNNSGGYLTVANKITSRFVDRDEVIVIESYKDKEEIHKSEGGRRFSGIPIAVLINEGSASASEILAGALKDNGKAKLVGEKTFGKGLVQIMEDLKDGSAIKISISRWLTPNRIDINENGIEPDFEVELTLEDYLNERDPQLEKALEILK